MKQRTVTWWILAKHHARVCAGINRHVVSLRPRIRAPVNYYVFPPLLTARFIQPRLHPLYKPISLPPKRPAPFLRCSRAFTMHLITFGLTFPRVTRKFQCRSFHSSLASQKERERKSLFLFPFLLLFHRLICSLF